MKKALLLNFIFILLSFYTSYSAQYSWLGSINSYWNEPNNWNPRTVPTANDTVTISSSSNNPILRADVTIKKIIINSGVLNVDIYTLTITKTAKLNGGEITKGTNGNLILQGDSAVFAGTLINTIVSATCNNILLNGSEFRHPAFLELIGNNACYSQGENIFQSKVTFKNSGSGLFALGYQLPNTFQDSAKFIATSGEGIVLNTDGKTYFNGHVTVSCSASNIFFGSEASDSILLAPGKKLSIATDGFTSGTFFLRKFIQLGTTAQDISLTSSAVFNCNNCIFNAPVHITSPIVLLNSSIFNDSLLVLKTGNVSSLCYGGNLFNGYSQFRTQNDGELRLANSAGDSFKGTVKFISDIGGTLRFAYTGTNYFYNNIELTSEVKYSGSNNGIVIFTGQNNQTFFGNTYTFNKIKVDKLIGNVQFDSTVTISDSLIFVRGNIITSASHLLTLKSTCKVAGASNASFVDGPVKKIGNTAFVFPIGNLIFYRPLEITAPSTSTDAFTAQYFHQGQNIANELDSNLESISLCNYWSLNRSFGSSNVNIKLSWDTIGCGIMDTTNLIIANFKNSIWKNAGSSAKSGNKYHGFINTNASVDYSYFTLGTKTSNNLMYVAATISPSYSSDPNISHYRSIPDDFVGFNGSSTIIAGQTWADLLPVQLMKNKAISTLRFPAGTTGNYWDWRYGWYTPEKQLPVGLHYNSLIETNPKIAGDNIEDFKYNADLTTSTPIFDWNILTSDFHYQLASLYESRRVNLRTKYVEMGNEFYINLTNYKTIFPTTQSYVSKAEEWSANLKAINFFQTIKTAIVGADSKTTDIGRKKNWLSETLSNINTSSTLDAITIHNYYDSGLNGSTPFTQSNYPFMLATPFINYDELAATSLIDIATAPKSLEVWITEFNLLDEDQHDIGTWSHALFVAAMTLKYMESPLITKIVSHTMTSNAVFGNTFSSANGFKIPAGQKPLSVPSSTRQWEFTAMGTALNQICTAVKNADHAQSIDFSNDATTIGNLAGSSYLNLYGWAFDDNNDRQVVILNLNSKKYKLDARNLFNTGVTTIEYELLTSLDVTAGIAGNPKHAGQTSSVNELITTGIISSGLSGIIIPPASLIRLIYRPSTNLKLKLSENDICQFPQTGSYDEQFSILVSSGTAKNTINFSAIIPGTGTSKSITQNTDPLFLITASNMPAVGAYTVTVTDGNGIISDPQSLVVHALISPVAITAQDHLGASVNSPQFICKEGSPFTLTAGTITPQEGSITNYSYLWTPSSGIIPGQLSCSNTSSTPLSQCITVSPEKTTTYIAYLTDGVCFSKSDPFTFKVLGNEIDAEIKVNTTSITYKKEITLCNNITQSLNIEVVSNYTGNSPSYLWSNGATTANITVANTNLTVGENMFTVTVTDGGCPAISDNVVVHYDACCGIANNGDIVNNPGANYVNNLENILNYTFAGSNPPFSLSQSNAGYNFTPTPNSTNVVLFNGECHLPANTQLTFTGCNLQFGENATLSLDVGSKLTLKNCSLSACTTNMWKGIIADGGLNSNLPDIEMINGTVISQAITALTLARQANFEIENTTFNNNYQDLVMENYQLPIHRNSPYAAFTDNYIRKSTFTSSGTTLLNGEYKLSAIELNDVENVVLGETTALKENHIEKSNFGIISNNSGFSCFRTNFNNIQPYGSQHWFSRYAILANEDNNYSDHKITIGDQYGFNNFTSSNGGVYLRGPANISINHNKFGIYSSVVPIADKCIYISNCENKDVVINNGNLFYDYSIGVYLHNVNMFNPLSSHNGTFVINDNIFKNANISSGTNFNGTAISVHNDFNYFLMNEGEIARNIIGDQTNNKQPRIGISVSEINNINIHYNEIYFHLGTNPSLYYKGIWMQNSYNALLWKNKIENTVKLNSGALFTGLESDNCLIPAFYCNRTYKISYGMYFHNDDEFARLQKNEIKQYEIGIQLDNANIGNVQGDDVTQTGYGNEWDDSETSENRVDGQTMSLNPIDWYFHNSSGYLNIESALPANNLVVKPFPNSNDISWDCQTDVPTHITSSVQRNKVLGDVIGDSASYTTGHETEQSYLRKTSTYGILSANPSLLNINDENDESFQSWFTTKTSSNIGKIANVDRLICFGDFIGAQSTINTIESTNDQEENYKVVYGIYLHHHLSDSAYSSTDSSTLYTVAILNPLIGGNAVYAARNILFLEIEDAPLGSNERKANYQPIINTIDLKVYPVPANENISLLSNDDLSNYLYEIKDISGRLILKGKFTHEIDLLGIESGIYFIQLIKDNSASFQTKFTVIKK